MTTSQVNKETATRRQDEQIRDEASTGNLTAVLTTVPRVLQPVFAVVNAPLIADVSREALLEWLRVRKEYEAVIEARCRATNEDVDENLLETMCETRWDADPESVTDEFLVEKIREITASFKNKELPDMDDLFKEELKLDLTISDYEARVTAYIYLANKIIKRNGVGDLFISEDGVKRKCKVLVKFLPSPLQKKVKNELDYRSGGAKSTVRKLYAGVNTLTLNLEKETHAMKKMKAKDANHGKTSNKKSGFNPFANMGALCYERGRCKSRCILSPSEGS